MAIVPWPNPIPGQPDQVVFDNIPLEIVPGKYSVEEADRFGEKVSQGSLKYADFNPYESAHAVAALTGGAGLRRYSDAGDDPTQFATLYTESNNVNCCFAPVVLSPEVTYEALPSATGPAVWMGETWQSSNGVVTKQLYAVGPVAGGVGLWTRTSTGPWNAPATVAVTAPLVAVGLFKNTFLLGFGGLALAQWVGEGGGSGQILQDGGQPLYAWAFTSDQASSYLAGGPASSDYNLVTSSINPADSYTAAGTGGSVACGDTAINSLAPGGGLVAVYVGKIDELGMIDLGAGLYHSLVPFDSKYETNCRPLKWAQASGANQARGSLALVFPRERSLWEYVPSDSESGTCSNIAPWSTDYRRPPNARGVVTAMMGTARWLYYAVQNSSGETWIYRNDQTTGAPHTWVFLGNTTVSAMAITGMFPGNPLMLLSADTDIAQIVLPLDGDAEFDDANCRYQYSGYVDIPDIDLGFPDEDKIGFEVRVVSDNLSGLNRYHDVQMSEDGGPWSDLGNIITSPSQGVYFPLGNAAKRIKLRIWFYTDDNTQSPEMWGFSLRVSLNTTVYRLFVFQVRVPAGSQSTLADDLNNPYITINHFWDVRRIGTPAPYQDPWNDQYMARLIKLQQQQALREPDHSPEWVVDFTLLEFLRARSRWWAPPTSCTTWTGRPAPARTPTRPRCTATTCHWRSTTPRRRSRISEDAMPLTAIDFYPKGPVKSADLNQYYNLFTGVMVDQPVTFPNTLSVGGQQGATTVPLKLYGAIGQTGDLIDLYADRTQAQPGFGFSAAGNFAWGPGGTSPQDTFLVRSSPGPGLTITPALTVAGNIIPEAQILWPSGSVAISDGGGGVMHLGIHVAVQGNLYIGYDLEQYIHEVTPTQMGIDPTLLIHGANAAGAGLGFGNAHLQVRSDDMADTVGAFINAFSAHTFSGNWNAFDVHFFKTTAGVGWPGVALLLDYDVDNANATGGRISMQNGKVAVGASLPVTTDATFQAWNSARVWGPLTVGNGRVNPGNLMLLVEGQDGLSDSDAVFVQNVNGLRLLELRNDGWMFTPAAVQFGPQGHNFQVMPSGADPTALVYTPVGSSGFYFHNTNLSFWNDTDPQGGGTNSYRVIGPSGRPAATYGGGEVHVSIRLYADADITAGTWMHAMGFLTTSDPTIKSNTTLMADSDCMARIRGAVPVYSYTLPPPSNPGYPQPNTPTIGFMATDVAKVAPEYVALDASDNPVSVIYGQMASLLWGALRDLDQRCQAKGI